MSVGEKQAPSVVHVTLPELESGLGSYLKNGA